MNDITEIKNDVTEIKKQIKELKELTAAKQNQVILTQEVAKILGVSNSHVYRLSSQKKIPHYKAKDGGKINYFNRDEVTRWVLHQRIKTTDEIQTEAATIIVTGKK
jgi:excisionase family DNA binding protein